MRELRLSECVLVELVFFSITASVVVLARGIANVFCCGTSLDGAVASVVILASVVAETCVLRLFEANGATVTRAIILALSLARGLDRFERGEATSAWQIFLIASRPPTIDKAEGRELCTASSVRVSYLRITDVWVLLDALRVAVSWLCLPLAMCRKAKPDLSVLTVPSHEHWR